MNQMDLEYNWQNRMILAEHPNPLNQHGFKCFSQNEEDGITLEILRRLGLSKGTFIEFGVGNGLENNTLILLSAGWDGAWVGAEPLAFDYKPTDRLHFYNRWINLVTLAPIMNEIASDTLIGIPDVFSMDLDGNDIHLVKNMLQHGIHPKLWIVEYNAKFPPPIEFSIAYDDNFTWKGDDYFGASFESYKKLFHDFGYFPVATNALSGSNAFFVKQEDWLQFADAPSDVYSPPRYHLYNSYAFPTSPKTVELLLGY